MLAVFYVAILWLLLRQQRLGRSSTPLVLGAFPAALLFLTLPPVLPVLQLMQAFIRIAETNVGAKAVVMPFSIAITRTLRLAALEFLAVIAVAVALQWLMDRGGHADPIPQESQESRRKVSWRRTIVLASALMAIPVGILNYVTADIPQVVTALTSPTGPAVAEPVEVISQRFTTQLLVSAVGGFLTAGILAVLACANVRAVRSVPKNDLATRYVWAAVCGSSMWAIWSAI